ncbi:low molecular weight phosphatase family protein [Marinimicrobium sp. ARAG 43.8]|uniref:arsenate-mycothiol transferase ArsC n=1 Tax=Marinimicrobium sp. ARAG 43.8 TaxID=3418719 RepID=UPI003CE6B29B
MLNTGGFPIKDRFGSKKGLARHIGHSILYHLGYYNSYKRINYSSIERIIFVCSGNICRSPLAEKVSESLGFRSDSYGLHCRGGDKADPRAIEFAKSIGLDLEGHNTKNISNYIAEPGDLLVGMEPQQARALSKMFLKSSIITLSGIWITPYKPYIHDPYNTNDVFFEKCERYVASATKELVLRVSQ